MIHKGGFIWLMGGILSLNKNLISIVYNHPKRGEFVKKYFSMQLGFYEDNA